jgi:hypothetical protein
MPKGGNHQIEGKATIPWFKLSVSFVLFESLIKGLPQLQRGIQNIEGKITWHDFRLSADTGQCKRHLTY